MFNMGWQPDPFFLHAFRVRNASPRNARLLGERVRDDGGCLPACLPGWLPARSSRTKMSKHRQPFILTRQNGRSGGAWRHRQIFKGGKSDALAFRREGFRVDGSKHKYQPTQMGLGNRNEELR